MLNPVNKVLVLTALTACGIAVCLKWYYGKQFVPVSRVTSAASPSQDMGTFIALPEAVGESQKLQAEPTSVSGWKVELMSLESLAKTDPEAAIRKVGQFGDVHQRKSAAMAVCRVAANSDPAMALKAAWRFNLGKFADDEGEHQTLEDLARRWADVDLGLALEWVASLPVDEELRRDRLVKGVVSSIARSDPPLAAKIVTETISTDSSVQVDAALEVLRHWSARDYRAAVTWLSSLPSALARERGIDQLASADLHGEQTSTR